MNAIAEFVPLAALLTPAIVLAGMNAWLALTGEEGTLLLPTHRPYPVVELPPVPTAPVLEVADRREAAEVLRKAA